MAQLAVRYVWTPLPMSQSGVLNHISAPFRPPGQESLLVLALIVEQGVDVPALVDAMHTSQRTA